MTVRNQFFIGIGIFVIFLMILTSFNAYTSAIKSKNQIEQDGINAAEDAKRQDKLDEQTQQINLNLCLSDADRKFNTMWNSECERLSNINESKYQTCVKGHIVSPEWCREINPVIEKEGCSLAIEKVQVYQTQLKNDKDGCYMQFGFVK